MKHEAPRGDDDPQFTRLAGGRPAPIEVQLAWFSIEDDLWLPTLLQHLRRGGCILVERTGDLLIMPEWPQPS